MQLCNVTTLTKGNHKSNKYNKNRNFSSCSEWVGSFKISRVLKKRGIFKKTLISRQLAVKSIIIDKNMRETKPHYPLQVTCMPVTSNYLRLNMILIAKPAACLAYGLWILIWDLSDSERSKLSLRRRFTAGTIKRQLNELYNVIAATLLTTIWRLCKVPYKSYWYWD